DILHFLAEDYIQIGRDIYKQKYTTLEALQKRIVDHIEVLEKFEQSLYIIHSHILTHKPAENAL
ncbi:MAG: hypothetical protein AAGA80_02480, partial [Cyanobacteria bacterium P01_F01_bin.143]